MQKIFLKEGKIIRIFLFEALEYAAIYLYQYDYYRNSKQILNFGRFLTVFQETGVL